MSLDLEAWRRRLRLTLEDGRASRGERAALRELSAEANLDHRERTRLRALVFEVARAAAPDLEILEWTEATLRALDPVLDVARPAVVAFGPGEGPRLELGRRIDACRRSLEAAVFTITDDRLTQALVRAAERGVRVRVIGDDDKAHDLGSDMIALLDHPEIEVALDGAGHMHHKFAVFDASAAATGSFNWTRSATNDNHENLLVTEESGAVRSFLDEFERLWRIYRR